MSRRPAPPDKVIYKIGRFVLHRTERDGPLKPGWPDDTRGYVTMEAYINHELVRQMRLENGLRPTRLH